MKRIAVVIILLALTALSKAQHTVSSSQLISAAHYDSLKSNMQLSSGLYLIKENDEAVPLSSIVQPPLNPTTVPANCNCLMTIDNTFTVVPFVAASPPDYRNDDGSSPAIILPFNFCLYGQNQTQVYINNNGNISFGSAYALFQSNAFPSALFKMIAPFWADADTRNTSSGLVYYKVTPTALIVRWQGIGYFSQHVDLLNDFQLIITDGTDPLLPPGSNVSFCYGDMQWTTGDASGGAGGFGGNSSTVGANMGDGVNYIQIGTFDQSGTVYNGPFGAPSQVSWLDNKQFFLDVCSVGGGGNIPPIMNAAQVCDTITICVGDTLPIDAQFLSPENNQVTSISAVASGTGLTTTSSVAGNPGTFAAIFVGMSSNIGMNTITLTGTDNGTPPLSTAGNIIVNVIASPTASFSNVNVCPGALMNFNSTSTPASAPLNGLHWDFGMSLLTNDTSNVDPAGYVYNNPGVYQVTLTVTDTNGCRDTAQMNVQVYYLPQVSFTGGPTIGCAPLCVSFTDNSSVQGSTVSQWYWQFGDGNTDTLQNTTYCYPVNGIYSVILTATSAQGCSLTDSIHNYINVIPGPQAQFTLGPQPVTVSDPTIYFTDQSTLNPLEWYWDFGTGGANSTSQNPSFVYPDTGTYTVMLIVSATGGQCPDTAYMDLVISPELLVWIPNAFTPNGDTRNPIFIPIFSDPTYVTAYEFLVFDRWGNLIFQTQDPLKGWDGYYKGQKVEEDTYVYRIRITGLDGTTNRYIGGVTVIR